MISIAVAGKPNSGKSTFFKAATMAEVEIANYPFTTINANHGVAYLRVECPCQELKLQNCTACSKGDRFVPVELIDVAGLVPDAHKGRGLGNEFLDNLSRAQVIIHVVDASGGTDIEGNLIGVGKHDPLEDIEFLEKEIDMWIFNILHRNWQRISRKAGAENLSADQIIAEQLGGIGVNEVQVKKSRLNLGLPADKPHNWSEEKLMRLVSEIRKINKPIIVAANKMDIAPKEKIEHLKQLNNKVIFISGAAELALKMAAKKNVIKYVPGEEDFTITDTQLSDAQRAGLEKLKTFLKENHGTGVQECINMAVFDVLEKIVVYPVEDENKYTDKNRRVLPDAFVVENTCTARDLAYKVHTDIGKGFLFGIDAKSKMRVGDKHQLKNNDVIKIVSTK
jgi:hypothetical protein